MKLRRALLGLLLLAPISAWATSWIWLSPEEYVVNSDLIAVVQIGPIHEVMSPEGVAVRSAAATIEQGFFRRFPARETPPSEIVIYEVNPNAGAFLGGFLLLETNQGRAFVMLKMNGLQKYYPYDRLSVQKPDGERVYWPTTTPKTEQLPLRRVAEEIKALAAKK